MAIHPRAIVDAQARIAATADIGPNAVIEGPVQIGEHVKVWPNAYINGWTEIGDRCEIHPGAVVGHYPQDFHFKGERSYCRIGAGTIIREFASVHRGTQPESWTIVGEGCFLLAYSHVGHNCEVGSGVKLYNESLLAGHAIIGENAIISAHCVVHQFARVGEYVMVGAFTRIIKDAPPFMKMLYESQCMGPNTIGLQRSGKFSADEILEVREAYRALYRSGLTFRDAVAAFAQKARTRTGRRILDFVNSESKMGFSGGRTRNWAPGPDSDAPEEQDD